MQKDTKKDNNELIIACHHGESNEEYYNAVVPPVFLNSLNSFKTFEEYHTGRYVYGRASNATVEIIEKKMAALENGAEGIFFASGMAATSTAILHATKSGGHIICQKSVYGPDKNFLNRICVNKLDISVTYVDMTNLAEVKKAVRSNTQLIMMESPATFNFEIIDIKGVVEIAKEHNIKTFADNTWCTPINQKPLNYGVDYVMHTASKYLGGHSDIIGGCLVVKDAEVARDIKDNYRELFGGIIGPMEAWLVLRGIRTLSIRIKEHGEVATKVANFLEGHPKVKKVYFPGLESCKNYEIGKQQMKGVTGLLAFELKEEKNAIKLIDSLKYFQKGCSWGGFESLALTPLYYEDEVALNNFGCGRGLIRIYCGLEGADALIGDLREALDGI